MKNKRNNADQIKIEDKQVTFPDWSRTSNFLARQIVDDLYRAGVDVHHLQYIVEQTLLRWPQDCRTWGKD